MIRAGDPDNKKEILVVGKAWKPRALIRAQLIEEGYDLIGLESLDEAMTWLEKKLSRPFLLIFDSTESGLSNDTVASLKALAGTLRVLLCAGPYEITDVDLSGIDVMVRPFFIKDLVAKVHALAGAGAG